MKRIIPLLLLLLSLFPTTVFAQTSGKRIVVNTESQTLTAYENGQVVYQTAVSTGLPSHATTHGTFSIYSKLPSQEMKGGSVEYGYYDLPNVPNVMYFDGGQAIHGAYWHNNFGSEMSHGCVNAPLAASAWLYNWAPVGTTVEVN